MIETIYRVEGSPRLALLTDIHNRPYGEIIESVKKKGVELICIAGDVVNGHGNGPQENVIPFLTACASIAPTYMSLGNHERVLDTQQIKEIEKTGVVLLENEYKRLDGLVIGGLTSGKVSQRETGIKEPEVAWLEEFAVESGFHILLSHHPEYFPLIPPDIDLILSGHAHGGQWRFFNRGVFAPGQGLFPRYTSGVYEEDGKKMIVSRGLANTAPVPRFNNPTEIVYVDPLVIR